jgi:uncharacterized protein involved in type VI secretion and phage assembly
MPQLNRFEVANRDPTYNEQGAHRAHDQAQGKANKKRDPCTIRFAYPGIRGCSAGIASSLQWRHLAMANL